MDFLITDFIKQKRDGLAHPPEQLRKFVSEFLSGHIKDYQATAWLMAVYFRGLSPEELIHWTEAMWKSGKSIERDRSQGFWIDKHSTGGVGDKTSLILVPLVSSVAERLFGNGSVSVPMISGRGLGLTGGTLDKLESVPGFRSELQLEEATALLNEQGFFMAGQSDDLAPADRKIYALRDVTGTVDSVPLIVSSILSKKLAASLNGLVLDVKVGRGATFETLEEAKVLTSELLRVGRYKGLQMTALITAMDEPLGYCVGHSLEIEECEAFLDGRLRHPGLTEIVQRLAVEMLILAGQGKVSVEQLEAEVDLELNSKQAHKQFLRMLEAQGGKWEKFLKRDRTRHRVLRINSPRDGAIGGFNAQSIAKLVRGLGGGRMHKEQRLDLEVGVRTLKRSGDVVSTGEALAEVTIPSGSDTSAVQVQFLEAVQWSVGEASEKKWVWETIR